MVFEYLKEAKATKITIVGEQYNHLFKARRHKVEEIINFSNLQDGYIYKYKIETIDKKEAIATLQEIQEYPFKPKKSLHVALCVIDIKNIEKILPFLNELGIEKISLIYCKRSQSNFKINFERVKNILISSCTQCGRNNLLEIKEYKNLKEFLKEYPDSFVFNFSTNYITNQQIKTIIIGSEGGFCDEELNLFNKEKIVGIESNLILKSETASIVAASKILF
ncbi:MAG: 16S rRNA (uracil(1498)-N(3))-methyltransferase [Campylobacterales bacterium]|nr:16S rRNA (uracil(1498)-N(3))-methyltransferase [Campylobacterales bacterium]